MQVNDVIDTHCHLDVVYQRQNAFTGNFAAFKQEYSLPNNLIGCVTACSTPETLTQGSDKYNMHFACDNVCHLLQYMYIIKNLKHVSICLKINKRLLYIYINKIVKMLLLNTFIKNNVSNIYFV
jgi:hypothetical protein